MADTAENYSPCAVTDGEHKPDEANDVVHENDPSATSSSDFLAELNLVMMVAFLTLSSDEISRLDEEPEKVVASEERQVRNAVQKRRHRLSDVYKAGDRTAPSRSQAKILDSRHGRKM